jgi:O-antigen/teichoic acid export membrane protein
MRGLTGKLLRPHPEYLGFGLRGAYTVLALLVSILLARLLGPVQLGKYYSVVAWVLLVGTMVQTGWVPYLVREVAAMREQHRYAELHGVIQLALRIVASVSIVAAVAFMLASWIFADSGTFILFVAASPIVLLLSTSSLRQAVTRGLGRPLLGVVCESLTRPGLQLAGLLLLGSGVLAVGATPLSALVVFVVAIAGSAVLAYILQRSQMGRAHTTERPVLPGRQEWLPSFIQMAIVGWAQAINVQIGTISLSLFSPDVDVAHFRIAQQLSLLLAIGLAVVGSLYAKDFSRLFVRGDLGAIGRLAARGALVSTATAGGIGGIFLVGGRPLITQIYGAAFAPAFVPLAVMILGQLISAVFGSVTGVSMATRNEHAAMRAHLASVIVNVALCALLVPSLGPLGAAAASAVSLATWNVLLFGFLRRRLAINVVVGGYRSPKPGPDGPAA